MDKIYNQKDHRVLCSIVEEPLKLNLEEDNLFMNEEEIGKKMVEGGNTDAVVIWTVHRRYGDWQVLPRAVRRR